MRTINISPNQIGALTAFQEFVNEPTVFGRLPFFDAAGPLLAKMIECGGKRLEAIATAELHPLPGDWTQAYVSFEQSQPYNRRVARILGQLMSLPDFIASSPDEQCLFFSLGGLVAELAHAGATGQPHVLVMLPSEIRQRVESLPPRVQPLAGFLKRHLQFVPFQGMTPVLIAERDSAQRFIELLESDAYSAYTQSHSTLADQSTGLQKLIADVEKRAFSLVDSNEQVLRTDQQGLSVMNLHSRVVDELHSLLPDGENDSLASALETLSRDSRRLLFYEFDTARLRLLVRRVTELSTS